MLWTGKSKYVYGGNYRMKKIFSCAVALILLLSCFSVSAFAERQSAIGLTDWIAEGNATGANTPAFLPGAENRPTKEDLDTMLSLANTYFQCHMLTYTDKTGKEHRSKHRRQENL